MRAGSVSTAVRALRHARGAADDSGVHGRRQRLAALIALCAVTVLPVSAPRAATSAGGTTPTARAAAGDVVVTVDRSRRIGVSRLQLGVTNEQHSLDPWGDAASVARGRELLDRAGTLHNQHIYGWGGLNPEP